MKYLVQVRKGKGAWRTKYTLPIDGGAPHWPYRTWLAEASFYYASTNAGPNWRKRFVAVNGDGAKSVLDSYVFPTIG
jgi:hypothetical protein